MKIMISIFAVVVLSTLLISGCQTSKSGDAIRGTLNTVPSELVDPANNRDCVDLNTQNVFDSNGGVILVCPGTYNLPGGVNINGNDIQFICPPNGATVIQGAYDSASPQTNKRGLRIIGNNVIAMGCYIDGYENNVVISGANNELRNMKVSNAYLSNVLGDYGSTSTTIIDVDSSGNKYAYAGSILLYGGQHHQIMRSNLHDNLGYGAQLFQTNNSIIDNNTLTRNRAGVRVDQGAYNTVTNNVAFEQNEGTGIIVNSFSTLVQKNKAYNNPYAGISVYDYDKATVNNNELWGNSVAGINLASSGAQVNYNYLHDNNNAGISLTDVGGDNHITDNTIIRNAVGIKIDFWSTTSIQSTNFIQDNLIMNNEQSGVHSLNAEKIYLKGNNVFNNGQGMGFVGGSEHTATRNTICFNTNDLVCSVVNSSIVNNTCDGNSACGSSACLTPCLSCSDPSSYFCGDVNLDNKLNIADLTYMVNYLFTQGPAMPADCIGNVNGLSSVDVADIMYLVDYMFSGGPAPACAQVTTQPRTGTSSEYVQVLKIIEDYQKEMIPKDSALYKDKFDEHPTMTQ